MDKRGSIIFLALILFLSLILNSGGIRWGLPSKERSELLPDLSILEVLSEDRELISDETKALVGHVPLSETYARILRRFLLYTHHPDEQLTLMAIARMNPREFDFNPHFFQYGGVFLFSVAVLFKIASLVGYLEITGNLDYFLTHPEEISRFYVVGRSAVVLSVLFAIIAIYLVSSFLRNRTSGLLAGALWAILPSTIIWAHTLNPHMFGIFLALISFYYAVRILKEGGAKNHCLAGVFAGLAAGAAINHALIIIPSFLAFVLTDNKEKQFKAGLVYCFSFLAAFFIPNFYWLFSFPEVLSEFRAVSGMWGFAPNLRAWGDYLHSIKEVLGFSVALVMIGGFFHSIVRAISGRDKIHLLLFITAGIYFLVIGSVAGSRPGYLGGMRIGLLLIAILVIMASDFIVHVLQVTKDKKVRAFLVILLLAVTLHTLGKTVVHGLNFYYDTTPCSTRILAGKWINEHISTGSSIRLWPSPAPFNSPPFRFNEYNLILDSSEKADYMIASYCPIWNNDKQNYVLLKTFEPVSSLFDIELICPFYFSNHLVSIFIRKDLYVPGATRSFLE